jgi:hypothetical protein
MVLARRDGCTQIAIILAANPLGAKQSESKRAATDFDSMEGPSRYRKDIVRLTRR